MTASTLSPPRVQPRPPGRLGRLIAARPRTVDALVVGILLAVWLLAIVQDVVARPGVPGAHADGTWALWVVIVRYATAIMASAALLLRRKYPVIVFTVVAVIGLFTLLYGWAGGVALAVATYSLAAHQPDQTAKANRVAQLAFAALAIVILVYGITVPIVGVGNALFVIAIYFAILALSISVRERRLYLSALIAHADAVEREQDQRAQLAVADEREHIAREMHDVIAHGLTVMVRLADGAGSRLDGSTEYADVRRAAQHIADTGRRSLADTRRMFSAFGDDEASREPQPTIEQIPTLVDDYRRAGMPVTVTQRGTVPTSPGVQLAVFRAVQESLTNVLKHAKAPSAVTVDLDFTSGAVITVTDDGAAHSGDSVHGSGRGITGMQQRAAIFGGEASAGPIDDGWQVSFRIPSGEGEDA
ncbi:sensor histidine kinase [Paramicrobacterium agarici]|uniref:sensor histidine kinase n=1 Tax=Paramicrobacterium agarici TaxID=630514 RepID=UPI001150B483|nr:histidine kinase [Microbacterium agarici]TQO21285.1 signal transduction histidine kinase [Microbacterium agarici]